ncbi:iron chelate uptake ABC transporter family permease subunit [Paenibacillus wynnii]|uniref:Iron ABC transporter permease n=1 Tax=Paenibacillus wynnii TaxID=268407 RepID=A0A098MC27_9BACL|nr:iron chelate uptake ABC transporter family permease subunit [Paenibacillus wynnii]KGE20110.1 iron ABC transporter permease [Paenibacillus wynnii]
MRMKLTVLSVAAVALIVLFMIYQAGGNWDYVLPSRGKKLVAILITGAVIAVSTIVFQSITNNRILTPSILGLDSLYMLIQTFGVFALGSANMTFMNKNINFMFSATLMVLFSGLLYKLMFRREGQNIYFLLLVGLIMGTMFQSASSFMEVLIDPNEFLVLQGKMFASFNNVSSDLLILSTVILALTTLYFMRFTKYLDVISLGRDEAINLGLDYEYIVKRLLMVIAIFVSISTALVGPITFLGLLVANVAHQLFRTYKHQYLIPGAILLSIVALVGGQFLVERVFGFTTTVSVIINFAGGVYFVHLLLKENKSW